MWKGLFKKKILPPQTPCNHDSYEVEGVAFIECAPLEDGHWTQFELHRCKKCGEIRGFPHSNLETAMAHGTEETLKMLREYGVKIPEKPKPEYNPSARDSNG